MLPGSGSTHSRARGSSCAPMPEAQGKFSVCLSMQRFVLFSAKALHFALSFCSFLVHVHFTGKVCDSPWKTLISDQYIDDPPQDHQRIVDIYRFKKPHSARLGPFLCVRCVYARVYVGIGVSMGVCAAK